MSMDNDIDSNASHKMSIMEINPVLIHKYIGFFPDFIWGSPPCQTYSRMSGGHHRNPKNGEYEKTGTALDHNHYFMRMAQILRWAKAKVPHLIFVIENPVGSLKQMPLMKAFKKEFHAIETQVHYCAFGVNVKKPTNLWTNDRQLAKRLSKFKCTCQGKHTGSVQREAHKRNHSCIPDALGEYVANYVNAKFVMDEIQEVPAATP